MYYKGEKLDLGHDMGQIQDLDFHGFGESIKERLSEIIPGEEDVRVLDVGTGMASTARFLLLHLSKRSRVWSLDPSEEILTTARAALAGKDKRRIRFVKGTADDLEFDDGSFDIVVSVMVMHHVEAVRESIAEMSRVLKRGGRLIIVDYSPEAHVLDFRTRHAKEDFAKSVEVSRAMKQARLKPRVEDHGKWYLVEGTRPPRPE